MTKEKNTNPCKICGKEFKVHKSRSNAKYCSRKG